MRILLMMLLLVPAFAGCLGDDGTPDEGPLPGTDGWDAGIVPGPTGPFSMFEEGTTTPTDGSGQGIWVHGGVLYWTNGTGLTLFDVRDPLAPVQMGSINEWYNADGEPRVLAARDVDVLEMDGATYAMVGGSGQGIHVIDVTDPATPTHVARAPPVHAGAHNIASIPGTPYVYVAGAAGLPASFSLGPSDPGAAPKELMIDVADFTDMSNPVVHSFPIPAEVGGVATTSDGCHDITVRVDLGRAYCGGAGGKYLTGGGESFIWDISDDPLNPTWISMVDDPRIVYHHQAFPNEDGTLLIVNDEYVGAYPYTGRYEFFEGGANNCYAADSPAPGPLGAEDQYPVAAAWIWDISDESAPELLSHIQNDQGWDGSGTPPSPVEGNCGSHFGDLVDGQEAFVMGWYEGGTIFVDFSDPAAPVMLDRIDAVETETWESRYWNGHVFHASGELLVTPLS